MKSYNQIDKAPKGGVEVRVEGNILRIFFDFEQVNFDREEEGQTITETQFAAESVDVKGGRDYSNIVSSIISDRYSNDDVQAILANYAEVTDTTSAAATLSNEITPEKREEYILEYSEFQMWRKKAKQIAQTVLTLI